MSTASSASLVGGGGGPWKLGEYLMQKKLGSGSFGEIYLGQHINSGQAVAIKIVGFCILLVYRLYKLLLGKSGRVASTTIT